MEKLKRSRTTLHQIYKSKDRHLTVKEAKDFFNNLETDETNFIDITVDFNENDDTLDIECYTFELESDEEFNKRVASVNGAAETIKKTRYEQYLKLKQEFENV